MGSSRSAPASAARSSSDSAAARSRPSVEVTATPQPRTPEASAAIRARSPPSRTTSVSAVWSASARASAAPASRPARPSPDGSAAPVGTMCPRSSPTLAQPHIAQRSRRGLASSAVTLPWGASAPPRVRDRLRAAPDGPVPVLHAGAHAVYVEVGGWCVGVVGPGAAQVPCALRVSDIRTIRATVARGRVAAYLGGGKLHVGGRPLSIGRLVGAYVPPLGDGATHLTDPVTVEATPPATVAGFVSRPPLRRPPRRGRRRPAARPRRGAHPARRRRARRLAGDAPRRPGRDPRGRRGRRRAPATGPPCSPRRCSTAPGAARCSPSTPPGCGRSAPPPSPPPSGPSTPSAPPPAPASTLGGRLALDQLREAA